jgi:hypothetical protein
MPSRTHPPYSITPGLPFAERIETGPFVRILDDGIQDTLNSAKALTDLSR